MIVFSFGLLALAALLDGLFWRRHRSRWLAVVLALSHLPILVMAVSGMLLRDNTTGWMYLSMWLFWLWLLLLLPRLVLYLFRALRLPRAGAVLALLTAAVLIWGATAGRTTVRVSRVEVCSAKLPAAFDGFRIVQLSDMHVGTLVSPERELQRLVDSVNAQHPDLILFTGDLVNIRSSELNDRIAAVLRGLHAPVAAVTGNHDSGLYIKDKAHQSEAESLQAVIDWQRDIGWQVLEDTTVYLVRGADSIALSGIAYDPAVRWKRHDHTLPPARLDVVYRDVPAELFNVTAVHLPQLWEQILETPYGDLTVAGHVHSMQTKLRLFGRTFSPACLMYDRWSGRYEADGRALYINDGTGYVLYPMRLGAWPEITLFTLRRCA